VEIIVGVIIGFIIILDVMVLVVAVVFMLSAKRAWKADRKALALGSFKKLLQRKGVE
jgi:hypothetical protein